MTLYVCYTGLMGDAAEAVLVEAVRERDAREAAEVALGGRGVRSVHVVELPAHVEIEMVGTRT